MPLDPEVLEKSKAIVLTNTLLDKLGLMVWYLQSVRRGARSSDPQAFNSLLDDPEVNNWIENMDRAGRLRNTRFTNSR